MLAALVIIGATACTETDENIEASQEAGISFYADIDMAATRVDITDEDGDKTWETIWEGNESLTLVDGDTNNRYTFANSEAEPNKFTCAKEGVSELLGGKVTILSESSIDTYTSYVGKKFLAVSATVDNFDNTQKISLTTKASFLRYTYNGEGAVTFTMTTDHQVATNQSPFLDENMAKTSTVTFEGVSGENWVPFVPNWREDGLTATLSYSIDGVKCKETTISNVKSGKIYNLGTLTDPEPAAKIYLVPNDGWKADGAWFSAHFFNSTDGFADVKLTDEDADGIYECSVPADMEKVLFCRMNPAFTEFAWNEEGATDENLHVWNQTADEVIGVEPDNYYYILDWAKGIWGNKDGYVAPEEPALSWVLTGSYCGWSETGNAMTETATANLFVVEDIELASGAEIKVKASHTWDISYGGGITNLNANSWMKAYSNGSNIIVAKSGTYDVYFEYAEDAEYSKLYLVEADGDYTNAGEQTENGVLIPDEGTEMPTDLVLGIACSFLGWDAAHAIPMVVADGWYVASGVELYKDDQFKIVKDKAWEVSYGGNGAILVADAGTEYTLVSDNSQNIAPTKNGKFDIYFNPSTLAFKYECVEEYADLMVNITVDNKANWSPLHIYLEKDGTALTPAEGALVSDNKYAISGDYIGSSLTCKFISGSKVSEPQNITIAKSGVTVTLEETIIKLTVTLNTDNAKKWWGTTMKIHAWNTGTSFDTSWPGNNMTYEGNYTWSVIVPSELVGKTVNYLVHNGNGWQSSDATVTISANGNTVTGSSIGIN